jgi:uncharacterized protein (TIGR03437 family)
MLKKSLVSRFLCLTVITLCGALFSEAPLFTRRVQAVQSAARRPLPDTTNGVHVWSDQILPRVLTEEQIRFAATRYAGAQKIVRSGADRLRAHNPNFLILHYRLGQMLGYRAGDGACNPAGDFVYVIEGNEWRQEWPGEAAVRPEWFYQYGGASRVFWCAWGSYLMDTDNAGWRAYWLGEVTRQLAANDNDGVFADSVAVPTHLGPTSFRPNFPAVDQAFEDQWSARINRWLAHAKQQFGDRYLLIPNVGRWVTTRDRTDFSPADGVMIEGFAKWNPTTPLDAPDWRVQMNRLLGLIRQNKVVIAQSEVRDVNDVQTRLFYLASYLLIKGKHTFIDLEMGMEPEWFPEYDAPIGSPSDAVSADVNGWLDAASGLYRRAYSNGLVVVNPTGETRTLNLGATYSLAQPSGGGFVPASGVPGGSLSYQPVTSVTLLPYSGAVLIRSTSAGAVASVNAASYAGTELAAESIATAFGTGLATAARAALSLPLPTNLNGTTVSVRDGAGVERAAPLFYVSPTQVNYLVPAGTAAGGATVTITNANGNVSTGALQIAAVAPGLFAAGANGRGLAAAFVVRVRSDGTQANEPIAHYDAAQQSFVPLPVGVSNETEQVYLALFGTGLRRQSAVQASVGGVAAPVSYAGPQSQFVGLDQVNVLLPRELAGRGEVSVELKVDGKAANAVTLRVR